jgi:hypothetical protein
MPGATVLRRRLPRRAHHRPLSPIDLRPNQEYCELPLHPLLFTDPKSHSDHLSSAPPTTATPPLSSSPSLGRLGEPLSTKSVPIESLGSRLAPRHHLVRPLAANWLKSVDGATPVKGGVEGGGQAPLFRPRAERSCGLGHLSWLGEFPCGLAARCEQWVLSITLQIYLNNSKSEFQTYKIHRNLLIFE